MAIEIRPAGIEELAILFGFEQGIVATERPFDPTLKEGEIHYYDLEALITSPESEVLVAVADGVPVGAGYAKIKKGEPYHRFSEYAYLGFMYVEPSFRGQGINKMILDHLIDWARKRNITEIRLQVYEENTIAKNAYVKAGFTPTLLTMRMEID